LTNDHTGGFALASSPVVGLGVHSVTAADVNGDGWVDLICANRGDGTLSVLTNDHAGGFVLATNIPVVGAGPCVTTAHVNGDGCADLISANAGNNTISVLTNVPSVLTNAGNGVVISWPSPSTGFVLQQNSNLSPTNWTTFGGIVSSNATIMSVTSFLAPGAQFYRLFHF
jgi:hypothetical protein